MHKKIHTIDNLIINYSQRISPYIARIALFIVYFWFGFLKILSLSPATSMVIALFNKTLEGFIDFNTFQVLFGLFEMILGLLFLFPKLTRIVIPLLIIHLFTTALPLILLPQMSWSSYFVPTLEGQYIIKNILIIACVLIIISSIKPLYFKTNKSI